MQPYKKLFTYWYALIIYDLTVVFTQRWIKSYKLSDQLDGAARSGKQNIVEGSDALKVSLKSGIKLTGVAKASFEELIGDLEDFLRQRDLEQWEVKDNRVKKIREFNSRQVRNLSNLYQAKNVDKFVEKRLLSKYKLPDNPEIAANLLLTLCHQVTFLLDRQIEGLIKKHKKEGGLSEKLYNQRKKKRGY